MADAPVQALFYSNPLPLSSSDHAGVRLTAGNVSFTQKAVCIPLVLGEFAFASRYYPVLFGAGEDNGPLGLMGLFDRNLFVEGDRWDERVYVPAYVRRYPFGLMNLDPNGEKLALCMDFGCPWVVTEGDTGTPLFEAGQPTQLTKDALDFCERFSAETVRTREFTQTLRARGLLLDRRLDGKLPDGKPFAVDGFQIIDEQKLTELDAETVVDWHRKGWLASAYYHLASLDRVSELVLRQSRLSQVN